jgi:hypothetical protein
MRPARQFEFETPALNYLPYFRRAKLQQYSQAWVQRPPLGLQNSGRGRCCQVVVIQGSF